MQSEKDALIELYAGDAFKNRNNNDLTIGVWRQHFVEFADKLAALSAAEPLKTAFEVASKHIPEARVSLLSRAIRQGLNDYGWKNFGTLPEVLMGYIVEAERAESEAHPKQPTPSVAVKALQGHVLADFTHLTDAQALSGPYIVKRIKERFGSFALSAQVQDVAGWQSMDIAPKDGTLLKLLVNPDQEEFTAFDDSLTPFETIGFNNLENTKEDRWEFAGWDWQQDCFITGRGEVLAWAIFDALKPLRDVSGYEDSQSAKLWPGQNSDTVIKEMQDVATGQYEGYETACDPWTADNRADIDRWQSIISDTLPAAPAKQEGCESNPVHNQSVENGESGDE